MIGRMTETAIGGTEAKEIGEGVIGGIEIGITEGAMKKGTIEGTNVGTSEATNAGTNVVTNAGTNVGTSE